MMNVCLCLRQVQIYELEEHKIETWRGLISLCLFVEVHQAVSVLVSYVNNDSCVHVDRALPAGDLQTSGPHLT